MTTMTELTSLTGPLMAFAESALWRHLPSDVRAEIGCPPNHVPSTHLSFPPNSASWSKSTKMHFNETDMSHIALVNVECKTSKRDLFLLL